MSFVSFASARSTSRTAVRPTFTSSLRRSSRGWCCRQVLAPCLSTTAVRASGPRRVWRDVRQFLAEVSGQSLTHRIKINAATQAQLRMLRQRSAGGFGGGAHLLVRVHVLHVVRDNRTKGQVSELRRRARRASAASRGQAREVSGLHAACAEAARLRRRGLKNPRKTALRGEGSQSRR